MALSKMLDWLPKINPQPGAFLSKSYPSMFVLGRYPGKNCPSFLVYAPLMVRMDDNNCAAKALGPFASLRVLSLKKRYLLYRLLSFNVVLICSVLWLLSMCQLSIL